MRVAWYLFDLGMENLFQIVMDMAEATDDNQWKEKYVSSHIYIFIIFLSLPPLSSHSTSFHLVHDVTQLHVWQGL